MFVAINRIRSCDDPAQFLDYEPAFNAEPEALLNDTKPLQHKEEQEQPPIGLGERVVWMSDYGPEHGLVKWVGFLHDTREREWTVGVEFVSSSGFSSWGNVPLSHSLETHGDGIWWLLAYFLTKRKTSMNYLNLNPMTLARNRLVGCPSRDKYSSLVIVQKVCETECVCPRQTPSAAPSPSPANKDKCHQVLL